MEDDIRQSLEFLQTFTVQEVFERLNHYEAIRERGTSAAVLPFFMQLQDPSYESDREYDAKAEPKYHGDTIRGFIAHCFEQYDSKQS